MSAELEPPIDASSRALRPATPAAPVPGPAVARGRPAQGELDLVARAAAGDDRAFERLVAAHGPFVYNVARRALGDAAEADDAAQEAFVRAWRGLPRFDGRSAFRTWLYRIAVRVCCDRRPGLARRLAELAEETGATDSEERVDGTERVAAVDGAAGTPTPAPLPERAAERGEAHRRVRAAVDALPDAYRMLVTLHYLEELTYDEVASLTGMPLGSLKVALHRARARLRAALDDAPAAAGAGEEAR